MEVVLLHTADSNPSLQQKRLGEGRGPAATHSIYLSPLATCFP